MPEWVDHLIGNLADPHHSTVLDKIKGWWRGSRGYNPLYRDQFTNEPHFTSLFETKSFRIYPPMEQPIDLLDSNSFTNGISPVNATEIQYKLNLEQHPPPISSEDLGGMLATRSLS